MNVIQNEKQLKITKKLLKKIHGGIDELNNDTRQPPLIVKALLNSHIMMVQDLEQQIATYESTKKSRSNILKEREISELPSLLTEYKIRSGLTQKQFSEQLGLKEQQLQRYEASNFTSVTFKNLLKFLDKIGLEIRIKETTFVIDK